LKIQTYYVNTSTGTTVYHRTSLLPEFHNKSAIQPRRTQDGREKNIKGGGMKKRKYIGGRRRKHGRD